MLNVVLQSALFYDISLAMIFDKCRFVDCSILCVDQHKMQQPQSSNIFKVGIFTTRIIENVASYWRKTIFLQ